jgi:DNA-binding transcriptional ArsR family regulator
MPAGTAPRNAGDVEWADRVFHALADATRRDIVALVLQGEHSVSDLARRYPMSFAAVQKHVAVLERAGLVTKRRHGREQRVSGRVETLRHARGLLDRLEAVWRGRIERIDDLLAEPHPDTSVARTSPGTATTDHEGAPA